MFGVWLIGATSEPRGIKISTPGLESPLWLATSISWLGPTGGEQRAFSEAQLLLAAVHFSRRIFSVVEPLSTNVVLLITQVALFPRLLEEA